MTPAESAIQNAISFECKKDALQQRQSGDWKISFTVQGADMDTRLSKAAMGTRYMAVLVQVGDDELPINQPAKGITTFTAATAPDDPKSAGAKRDKLDWREVQPSAQSGIRANDVTFQAFLREELHYPEVEDAESAAMAIRHICKVHSRAEFSTDHRKRVLWHQLDAQYQAWEAKERVGA